jgi:hypothetical protein
MYKHTVEAISEVINRKMVVIKEMVIKEIIMHEIITEDSDVNKTIGIITINLSVIIWQL